METKRIFSGKRIAVIAMLLLLNVLLFVRENKNEHQTNQIYDELVNDYVAYQQEQEGVSPEAAKIAVYRGYLAKHPDAASYREAVKAARNLYEESVDYVSGLKQSIQRRLEQADTVVKSGIYSDKRSFDYINIVKTRYDLSNLDITNVQVSNGIWLVRLKDFGYINYFILMSLIVIVYAYFEERKKGLLYVVRASGQGRWLLLFKRTGILAGSAAGLSVLFYGVTGLISLFVHGGWRSLSYSVLSDAAFPMTYFSISWLGYFIMIVLAAAFFAFTLAMMLWCILAAVQNTNLGLLLFFLIYGAQYLCYTLISEKSVLRLLRYFNLHYLMKPFEACRYQNWGFAFGVTEVLISTVFLAVLVLVVAGGLCIWFNIFRYPPAQSGWLAKGMFFVQRSFMRILAALPMFAKELYKVLVLQRMGLVLAAVILLVSDVKVGMALPSDAHKMAMSVFYQEAQGMSYSEELAAIYNRKEQEYEQLRMAAEEKGDDTAKYNLQVQKAVLDNIASDIAYVKEKNEKGIHAVIISPYSYESAFGDTQYDNMAYLAFLCMLSAILLCSGVIAYEKKEKVLELCTAAGKRKQWNFRKALILLVLIAAQTGICYGIYYSKLSRIYTFGQMSVSVQSLQMFDRYPLDIPIIAFWMLDIAVKIVLFLAIGGLMWFLSYRVSHLYAALLGVLLVAPHIMVMLGFTVFEAASLPRYFAFFPNWNGGGMGAYLAVTGVVAALGGAGYAYVRSRYR